MRRSWSIRGSLPRGAAVVVSHEASRTGAPKVAIAVTEALADGGAPVAVVVRWPGPLVEDFERAATGVVLEPARRSRVLLRRFRRSRRAAIALEVRAARRVLRALRPSVVVLNTVKSAAYLGPAVELGIPTVLYAHETGALLRDTLRRYDEGALRLVQLAGCSPAVCEELADIAGVDVGTVAELLPTIDVALVRLRASEPISVGGRQLVVACATANAGKGVDVWLDAARLVASARPDSDARFVWVGDDRDLPASKTAVPSNVVLAGPLENPYPWISRADIFTLPSRRESYPLAVLEAMALGRAIVATDVGAVADQLGGSGVLVPPGDASALAAALVSLLDDPDRRRALGASAAIRIERVASPERFRASVREVAAQANSNR